MRSSTMSRPPSRMCSGLLNTAFPFSTPHPVVRAGVRSPQEHLEISLPRISFTCCNAWELKRERISINRWMQPFTLKHYLDDTFLENICRHQIPFRSMVPQMLYNSAWNLTNPEALIMSLR